MAFNPSPKVAAARDFAKRFGKSHVIILSIGDDTDGGETLEYASYGRTPKECKEAEGLADALYNRLWATIVANAKR